MFEFGPEFRAVGRGFEALGGQAKGPVKRAVVSETGPKLGQGTPKRYEGPRTALLVRTFWVDLFSYAYNYTLLDSTG